MAALIGSIQIRKDTAANWTTNNPTLLSGEIGLETDTRRVKIGDGATLWNALAYSLNPLGVAAATDILRRSDGDGRYDATGSAAAAQAAAIAASQPLDADLTAYAIAADATARRALIGAGTGNGDALVANPLSQFAATTSAQLKGVISDEMAGGGTLLAFGTSGVEAAYTGTPNIAAGTAPSGGTLTQFYTQVGNLVTFQIQLTYTTGALNCTGWAPTFPTEFPTPHIPAGFTGANARIYQLNGRVIASPTANGGNNLMILCRNAADTGFEFQHVAFAATTVRVFIVNGSYFTA